MIYLALAVFLFIINNLLWKVNLGIINLYLLITYRAFFTFIFSFTLTIYIYSIDAFFVSQTTRITLGSLFAVLGLYLMLFALKNISLQWLGIYNLMGIIFSSLYLIFFENLDLRTSLPGILLVFLGFVIFISNSNKSNFEILPKNHFQLLLMILAFNTASIFHWKSLNEGIPPLIVITNQEGIIFLTTGIVLILKRKVTKSLNNELKLHLKRVTLMAIVIVLALICTFMGLKMTNPVISGVLFLKIPLLTILFSSWIFKEKINYKNKIAILLLLLGSVYLIYLSNP
jgi:hypothetical protein